MGDRLDAASRARLDRFTSRLPRPGEPGNPAESTPSPSVLAGSPSLPGLGRDEGRLTVARIRIRAFQDPFATHSRPIRDPFANHSRIGPNISASTSRTGRRPCRKSLKWWTIRHSKNHSRISRESFANHSRLIYDLDLRPTTRILRAPRARRRARARRAKPRACPLRRGILAHGDRWRVVVGVAGDIASGCPLGPLGALGLALTLTPGLEWRGGPLHLARGAFWGWCRRLFCHYEQTNGVLGG